MSERRRSYSWEDPTALGEAAVEMPGLEFWGAVIEGSLPAPPICETLGFYITEVGEGRCVLELEPGEHQYNPLGVVHGSVIIAALDSAAGTALHTTLPAGVGYTTVTITTNFLRPVLADSGTLTCEGTLAKAGRRIGLTEARLVDAEDRLVAHATATQMILR